MHLFQSALGVGSRLGLYKPSLINVDLETELAFKFSNSKSSQFLYKKIKTKNSKVSNIEIAKKMFAYIVLYSNT
jgi:hypothetical protein